MRYKLLGKSGLRVSELCLGAMTFGEDWGWGASRQESKKMYDAFRKIGGNFIDTANIYTNGTSEKFVGEFLRKDRDEVVLATKYSNSTNPDDPNASGNHRKNIKRSLEASLKRLKTDYIDLYWIHYWDFMTPVEEVMRALDDLIRSGKVLYIGISDAPAWVVSRANTMAELIGWSQFIGLQIEYSLVERTPERELLPMARSMDIGVTPWSPLGSGVLTGKYNKNKKSASDGKRVEAIKDMMSEDYANRIVSDRNLEIAREVLNIADESGKTPAQVAINWVRQKPGVMVPILGARKLSQLKDNLGCLDFELTHDQMDRLNKVSEIKLGFPHDFLSSEEIRRITLGNTYSLIDKK